jgi:serine/threonine protein kinase
MTSEPIGQQFGDYQVLSALGQGTQACVYLGQHIRLQQRLAAVKLLQAQLSLDDIADFQREAETIARLQHPQIVNILDFNEKDGVPFIVMDYYPCGTLRERHPHGERVPFETVVTYVQQVAEALQHAHDHTVIHRDVKPANMLIGYRDTLVLSDFGIAASAYSTSSMCVQNLAGTIAYMAQEQMKQFPRRESDQYALAIVVYEWLAGALPFTGTPEEIAIKHLMVEPPTLLDRLPDLPQSVEQVIFKALAKDPKKRFPCVLDFALALLEISQSQQSLSRPIWIPLTREDALKPGKQFGQALTQQSCIEEGQASGKPLTDLQTPGVGCLAEDGTSEERESKLASEEQETPASAPREVIASPDINIDGGCAEVEPDAQPLSGPQTGSVELEFVTDSARPLILATHSKKFSSTPSKWFPSGYQANDTLPIVPTDRFQLIKGRSPSLNGKEIMKRIGRQDTPPAWCILLPSSWKLVWGSLWRGLNVTLFSVLNAFFLFWSLLILPPPASGSPESSHVIEQIWITLQLWGQKSTAGFFTLSLLGPILVALLLGCSAAFRYRIVHGQYALVLLPEGLVYGKRSQQKRLQVIDYQEVANLRAKGAQIIVQLFKKNGRAKHVKLDLSLFPSSTTLARTIKAFHDDYVRGHR